MSGVEIGPGVGVKSSCGQQLHEPRKRLRIAEREFNLRSDERDSFPRGTTRVHESLSSSERLPRGVHAPSALVYHNGATFSPWRWELFTHYRQECGEHRCKNSPRSHLPDVVAIPVEIQRPRMLPPAVTVTPSRSPPSSSSVGDIITQIKPHR